MGTRIGFTHENNLTHLCISTDIHTAHITSVVLNFLRG